jgi:hypothetical protein
MIPGGLGARGRGAADLRRQQPWTPRDDAAWADLAAAVATLCPTVADDVIFCLISGLKEARRWTELIVARGQ